MKDIIIGVIAAVRHILTVGASMTLASGKSQADFDRAVIELGISTGIVVALVFAIFLSKASNNLKVKQLKAPSSQTWYMGKNYTLLDGGLATALEDLGNTFTSELWTGELLKSAPDQIREAHAAFVKAGAEIIITSTR